MRQTKLTSSNSASEHFFRGKPCALGFLFSTLLLVGFGQGMAQPLWTNNSPSIVSGASSADITVQLNEKGSAYYVVYSTPPSGITADKIKADAMGTGGGTIVRRGTIPVTAVNTNFTTSLTGIPNGATYYFYLIAQGSSSGLQEDAQIKSFTQVLPKRQISHSFRSKFGPDALVGYLAYVPEAYYKNPTATFPVLLMLHGMNEKVWDPQDLSQLYKVRGYGPARLIDNGQEFPFIVITPQCPFASWDDVTTDNYTTMVTKPGQFVNEIYDMIEANYRVDKSKEYLTGISMGGEAVWTYLGLPNDRLAAAIPIAGWGNVATACVTASQNVAVWAFQGENDGAASIQNIVSTLNNCKPAPANPAKVTVYPGLGHSVWPITYDNTGPGIAPDNIYDWLMRHTKSKNSAAATVPNKPPVANAGVDIVITSPISIVSLIGKATDTDGTIVSYAWTQKKGKPSVLVGAATSSLSVTGLLEGAYEYILTVKDNDGAIGTDSVFVTVKSLLITDLPPPTETASVSDGLGLSAEYFTNKSLSGTPFLTEIDSTIDFDWGGGAPKSNMSIDLFSIRWTGEITPDYSDTYTFYANSDDGINVWVDDQLIISNWSSHAATENSGKIDLLAGEPYNIKVEYYELWSDAEAKLSWSSPNQPKQIVPKKNLSPNTTPSFRDENISSSIATSSNLSVYPMPAKDITNVSFLSSVAGTANIKLVDELSQVRYQTSVPVSKGNNTRAIDLSQITSGLYILVVNAPDKTETTRMVITK